MTLGCGPGRAGRCVPMGTAQRLARAGAWGQQNSPLHCVQTVSVLSVPHLVKNTHHQNPTPVPGEDSEVIRNQTSGSSQREAREEAASGLVRTHSGHLGG